MRHRNASTVAGIVFGALSALMLLSGCSARVHAGQTSEEFHQTYPLAAGGRLELTNVNGNVTILAADTREVKVDATRRGSDAEQVRRCRIEVTANPDSIRIETKYDKGVGWFRNNNNSSVDYRITVPRSTRLGSISLVNGNTSVTGVTGDIHAAVVNGNVLADDVTGELDLSSVNGRVEVTLKSPAKNAHLHSVNGGVVLTAPSDLQAEVKANTVNGRINNTYGLMVDKGRHVGSSMSGRLGAGGARIELNTVNGSIDLLHATDGRALSKPESQQAEREQGEDREPL